MSNFLAAAARSRVGEPDLGSRLQPLLTVLVGVLALTCPLSAQEKGKKTAAKTAAKPAVAQEDEPLLVADRLTSADPTDPSQKGKHHKIFPFKMAAGKTYVIEMIRSGGMRDPYLRLDDAKGKTLVVDDDSAGNMNARITFKCAKADTYKIIATTLGAADFGEFTLKAAPLGAVIAPGAMKMVGLQSTFGDIVISRQPAPTNTGGTADTYSHGYIEHRYTITNRSETDAHRVTITVPRQQTGGGFGNWIRRLRRSVEVGPKSSASISLYVPEAPSFAGGEGEVQIDGVLQRDPLWGIDGRGTNMMHYGGSGKGKFISVLAQGDLVAPLQNNNNIIKSGNRPPLRPGRPSRGSFGTSGPTGSFTYQQVHNFFASYESSKTWTRNWLGYSLYDGVVLPGGELDQAPPEAKAALWHYVEAGGSLLIVGATHVLPENWRPAGKAPKGFTSYYPGLGRCLKTETMTIEQWGPEQWWPVTEMWEQTVLPFDENRSPSVAQAEFPVVENLGIPVRGLFLLMLIFAVLIGPVNLYVLSRKRRRIWLLWTVPLFSLITCAAVFGFMIISEGWHGHARTEGLTVLDENTQRATTIGWQGFYCPLTPGEGLHYDYETELTPQLGATGVFMYNRGSGASRSIDWTEDQHLDSGWVTARVPAHFQVRTAEKRLERILVRKEKDGAATMVNGLKAGIDKVWLADTAGKVYAASAVAPGGEAILTHQPEREANGTETSLRNLYTGDWVRLVSTVEGNPFSYLRPGTYVAILNDTPFFAPGLRQAQSRKGRSVVIGIMKEPF